MGDDDIRVLSWNLFHGQDGARLGPTLASTLVGRGVDDGVLIHLNRKWIPEMAGLIASRAPTVAALQEVPPRAVATLERLTGMRAAAATMPPLVGSTRLRGSLASRNPDLWRTHEGTANVVLVAPPWEIVPGGAWTVRHNPPRVVATQARALRLPPREALHWLLEPRRLVAVRIRRPDGRTLTAVSLHCHNSLEWDLIAFEVRRVLPRILERIPPDDPLVIAGDFNATGAEHPALQAVVAAGLGEDTLPHLGLDHIFHRELQVVHPPRALPRSERELSVLWRGAERRVLLSDHDPVEAVFRLPPPTPVR